LLEAPALRNVTPGPVQAPFPIFNLACGELLHSTTLNNNVFPSQPPHHGVCKTYNVRPWVCGVGCVGMMSSGGCLQH
jgi:hypothetical protein